MNIPEAIVTVYGVLTSGAIVWLFKSVVDMHSQIKVLQAQREAYQRELDKIENTLEQIVWED